MSNQPEFTVTKSTVECYKIRHPQGYWADITIDAQGRTGRIQIASDFGSWQNYWGACGEGFKSFLASLNRGYVEDKFGVEDWISVHATITSLKKRVLDARKKEEVEADDARCIYNEIKAIQYHGRKTLEVAIYSMPYLSSFMSDIECFQPLEYEPNPHFDAFWKKIWPVLLAEFTREAELVTA